MLNYQRVTDLRRPCPFASYLLPCAVDFAKASRIRYSFYNKWWVTRCKAGKAGRTHFLKCRKRLSNHSKSNHSSPNRWSVRIWRTQLRRIPTSSTTIRSSISKWCIGNSRCSKRSSPALRFDPVVQLPIWVSCRACNRPCHLRSLCIPCHFPAFSSNLVEFVDPEPV